MKNNKILLLICLLLVMNLLIACDSSTYEEYTEDSSETNAIVNTVSPIPTIDNSSVTYNYKSSKWAYNNSLGIQPRGTVELTIFNNGIYKLRYEGTNIFGISKNDLSFNAFLSEKKKENGKTYLKINSIEWTSVRYDDHVTDFLWGLSEDKKQLNWLAWDFIQE